MAVGPKRPTGTPEGTPTTQEPTPEPKAGPSAGRHAPLEPRRGLPSIPEQGPGEREAQQHADAELTGEGRIGDESVTAPELAKMGTLIAARHLMTLLAKKRVDRQRDTVLAEVGELVLGLEDPDLIRRLLLLMGDAGRIVDIYPLEVMAYVLQRRPGALRGIEHGDVILNADALTSRTFGVGETISIKVPLSLRMRAFALVGGGSPGYCLAPGPPGEYHLELGEEGSFQVMVRGDIRKKSYVDRVHLAIEEPPGTD